MQVRIGKRRLRLLERDPIGLRVDSEQDVAALHPAAVADENLHDLAVHLRADGHDILPDLRVVGGHAAAAGQPVIDAADDQDCGHDQHEDRLEPIALTSLASAFPLRRCFSRFGRCHRFGLHLVHWFEALFSGTTRDAFSRTRPNTCRVIAITKWPNQDWQLDRA